MTKKVLIDRDVIRNAITHDTRMADQTVNWGGRDHTLLVAHRHHKAPRKDETFRNEQIGYVAAITDLVSEKKVKLYRSFEQVMERARQRSRGTGYLGLDLLKDVPIEHAEVPVSRTIVISGFGQSYGTTKEEQIEFLKSISEPRFEEVRAAFGDAHILDAFHFWTTEYNDFDAFLTMDRHFINVFKNQAKKKLSSNARVISPKELCEEFGVGPKDLEQIERDNPPFA